MDRSDRGSTMLDAASMTALAAMNHLVPIAHDEGQAWENIEIIADAIDVVVALVENNQMSDETGKAATVDYLLKMLNSPCEEVVKLSLSGLDRIVFKTEVAVYAVRIGAFEHIANLITHVEDGGYEKIKSSDVLAFLMAPPENKYLKTSALSHKVFDEHLRMVMKGNEKEKERGLQFLWCITHNCKEAQEKVIARTELFSVILQAIADADCGRNALRLLHNLSKLENAKRKLPVKEISNLVKPIMNIPDHIISKKDKAITALTVANLLETGQAVDSVVVSYLRDMVYELADASFYSSKFTLMEVISCFNTLASKDENKMTLAECNLIKTLIDTMRLKDAPEKIIGKGYTLSNVKETAAKTLWYLAYSEPIQKRMREDGGGLDELKTLFAEVQEDKLKKNIKDILWIFELRDANQKMSNLKASAGGISRPLGSTSENSSPGVAARSAGSPSLSPSPAPARALSPTPSPSYSTPSRALSPTPSSSYTTPSRALSPTPSSSNTAPARALSPTPTSSSTPSYKPPAVITSTTSSSPASSSPSYKPATPTSTSSTTPSYKSSTPTSTSTPSTPSYKPPTPTSTAAPSTPSYKPPTPTSTSTPSTPSYKPPTPTSTSTPSTPSYKPPTPTSTSSPSTPSYKPPTSSTSSSTAPSYKAPTPSYKPPTSSSSPATPAYKPPTPTTVSPATNPSPTPSVVPSEQVLQLDEATTKATENIPVQKTTTKFTPSPVVASGPKFGKVAASSATISGEKPKWMVGGARQAATAGTTPTSSVPTTASGEKPKWFVSKKA